jgi:hypothetical protein
MTGGRLHGYLPETGSDQYALVISVGELTDAEVEQAWNRSEAETPTTS